MSASRIGGYSKIYNLGHAAVADLFDGPVTVEEKVDGSQFSFMKEGGQVHFRSKRVAVHPGSAGMFEAGCAAVLARKDRLRSGYVYRSEYLQKPKHNVLCYSRTPHDHVVIYDVDAGDQSYLSADDKATLAAEIDFESIPVVQVGEVSSAADLDQAMDRVSFLGGAKVEGLVFKNYAKIDAYTGKTLMGKHVGEHFKEVKDSDWKSRHPNKQDVVEALAARFRTEARWHKALQHMRDDGRLTGSPQDIGPLLKEVREDLREECEAEIKAALFKWAFEKIGRKAVAGLPEWYKRQLAESQFA